jgi:four helix bundle protein
MSNTAEGFERSNAGEFFQFLSIAKSSCAELRSHLYVALDVGYLECAVFEDAMGKARETAAVIGGLRAAVKRHRDAVRRGRNRVDGTQGTAQPVREGRR